MGNKELDVLMYPECTEKQYDQEKWKELSLLTCSVSSVYGENNTVCKIMFC